MALLALMQRDDEERSEREFRNLRMQILLKGITPEQVPKLLESLDGEKKENELGMSEWAEELDDEQMEEYIPLSVEETDDAIDLMRRFGIAVQR